ncbi:hypothetical protein BFC17_11695 [Alteromonas lipolytica]|uniref:Uncharacterized protein n=2 Tax=Alteromonas lipolytica TaxID=1856405 RepID=A0A1E8FHL2_9ALTE|nr:hypothetical protein BFC17_11695 [Alteromonas lipolytica]
MSPSGMDWRISLHPFQNLYFDEDGFVRKYNMFRHERVSHSSANGGNCYFGLQDAKGLTVKELAERLKVRFPDLMAASAGTNYPFVGWFTHMLGVAEIGALPVFSHEFGGMSGGMVFTSVPELLLPAPPYPVIMTSGNLRFLWAEKPCLNNDWHKAYQPVIDALKDNKVQRVPKYPSYTTDLLVHAAYWEGAVYYLHAILGFISEIEYIETRARRADRLSFFLVIFDSEGQLDLLDAYFSRVLMTDTSYRLNYKIQKFCQQAIDNIETAYRQKPCRFPNPYFGGSNPLHLTRLEYLAASR